MSGLFAGIFAYFNAIDYVRRLKLWNYFLIPAVVTVLLGVTILGAAWNVSDEVGQWLFYWIGWEWARDVLGAVFILAAGLIVFRQLVMALAAPFMSPMSETIEMDIRGQQNKVKFSTTQFVKDLIRGLTIAVRNIFIELTLTLILTLLGFIPGLTLVVPVLIFLLQSYYAGFGNMDYTLERHFNVKESVQFVKKHWGVALGNGAIFILILLTGIGFLFAIPLGAAAATPVTVKRL